MNDAMGQRPHFYCPKPDKPIHALLMANLVQKLLSDPDTNVSCNKCSIIIKSCLGETLCIYSCVKRGFGVGHKLVDNERVNGVDEKESLCV